VLLGISEAKKVLILDTIATIIKFVTGLALVATGFGASGILLSFLIQGIVISFISLVLAIRIFGCKVGNMNYLKEILRDGLVNVPSQLSGLLIFSLSVVLLASFGVPNSNIGVFYISLMISFVVGSFVSSMALMLIPWASKSNTDMSIATTRIGISLSAPIIAVLISSPKLILSFVGPEYLSGETILVILSVSILPFAVMINSISKFNFTNDPKKIILIGATQLMVFLITFFLLVPKYGILGAAISILIAFIASSIPSVVWSDRLIIKYIINTCIAILVGSTMGYVVASVDAGGSLFHIASVILSVSVTFALVIVLGNTSRSEITQMIKTIVKI
jgi:O-antigen/teichoic acid export membrane protein